MTKLLSFLNPSMQTATLFILLVKCVDSNASNGWNVRRKRSINPMSSNCFAMNASVPPTSVTAAFHSPSFCHRNKNQQIENLLSTTQRKVYHNSFRPKKTVKEKYYHPAFQFFPYCNDIPNFMSYTLLSSSSSSSSSSSEYNKDEDSKTQIRRTSIRGISVSPTGFLLLLTTPHTHLQTQNNNDNNNEEEEHFQLTLPLRLTSTIQDAFAATSPESLTICQLLSGVDMAGAILNPGIMESVVGLYCSPSEEDDDNEEEVGDKELTSSPLSPSLANGTFVEDELGLESTSFSYYDDFYDEDSDVEDGDDEYEDIKDANSKYDSNGAHQQEKVKEFVKRFLSQTLDSKTAPSYQEANAWQRNRVIFPKISLDSVKIDIPMEDAEEWKAAVMNVGKRKKELGDDGGDSNDAGTSSAPIWKSTEGAFVGVSPVPFKFVLECRIDGDKTLDVPFYSEVGIIENACSNSEAAGDYDGENDVVFENENSRTAHEKRGDLQKKIEKSKCILQELLYSYDIASSAAFLTLALALRYKSPVVVTLRALETLVDLQKELSSLEEAGGKGKRTVCIMKELEPLMEESNDMETEEDELLQIVEEEDDEDVDVKQVLPLWRSLNSLQSQSERVVQNIEQGFQVTKLQSAKRIALEKGDKLAAKKIQAEIDKLMNPTQGKGGDDESDDSDEKGE